MSGNLGGFRSSRDASRRAAHLPRDVILELVSPGNVCDELDKVAAGMNPAAPATLV